MGEDKVKIPCLRRKREEFLLLEAKVSFLYGVYSNRCVIGIMV